MGPLIGWVTPVKNQRLWGVGKRLTKRRYLGGILLRKGGFKTQGGIVWPRRIGKNRAPFRSSNRVIPSLF